MGRSITYFLLGTALVGTLSQTTAQTTFNVVQQHPSTLSYNGSLSVNELTDGYLVFSYGWSLDSTVGAVHAIKHDLEGNFQWLKEHRRSRNTQPGVIDPIARASGDRFVAAMTEYGGDDPKVTYLYWWNVEGDTVRTRFLKSDSAAIEGSHGTRQLVALSDGGFLHCGWCSDPINTGCITRLDSAGTILWERLYLGTNSIERATPLSDGGFILGGTRNGQLDKAVVIRTDSLGMAQWTRYHGSYSLTGGERALIEDTGNILVPGSWNPDPAWNAYDRWASLYAYTVEGSFVSRSDFEFNRHSMAKFILPKAQSHYWLIGSMFQYGVDPDAVMLLWELDENLDSLWMRRYWYYAVDDAENFMYSARNTSDGGLVMCGMTKQGITDPLPYMQSNWLLKLDAYGCLVPGCHTVGIRDHELGLQSALHLSPNPAHEQVSVALTLPDGYPLEGAVEAMVLDAQGRTVVRQRMANFPAELRGTLDVGGLPAGLYYLHLHDGAKWLAGGKLVVE